MDNKLEDQFLIIQYLNEKEFSEFTEMNSDKKKTYSETNGMKTQMTDTKALVEQVLVQDKNSYLDRMDSTRAQDTSTAVQAKNKAPILEGRNNNTIGGMWNMKHYISSSKFY